MGSLRPAVVRGLSRTVAGHEVFRDGFVVDLQVVRAEQKLQNEFGSLLLDVVELVPDDGLDLPGHALDGGSLGHPVLFAVVYRDDQAPVVAPVALEDLDGLPGRPVRPSVEGCVDIHGQRLPEVALAGALGLRAFEVLGLVVLFAGAFLPEVPPRLHWDAFGLRLEDPSSLMHSTPP